MRQTPYFDQFTSNGYWPGDVLIARDGSIKNIGQFNHKQHLNGSDRLRVVSSFPLLALSDSGDHPVLLDGDDFIHLVHETDESLQFMTLIEIEFNETQANHELKPLDPFAKLGLMATPIKLGDYFTRNLLNKHLYRTQKQINEPTENTVAVVDLVIEQPVSLRQHLPMRTVKGKVLRLNYPKLSLFICQYPANVRRDQNGLNDFALLLKEGSIYAQYVKLDEALKIAELPYGN